MIRVSCIQVRALMDQRSQGLSDADRLRLESHTTSCVACAEHSALLSGLVTLAQSAPSALGDAARQRTIARALSHPIAVETVTTPLAAWPRWALSGGLVLALAATVVALRSAPTNAPGERPTTPRLPTQSTVAYEDQRPTPEYFEASAPRRVQVPGATLELSAHTRVEWDAARARVTLQRGTVRAVVASREGQKPFSVRTPAFDVIVVGTDFQVSEGSVSVYEGVVRVQDHGGQLLREALGAGETWNRETTTTVPAVATPRGKATTPNPAISSVASAPQWIDEARSLLAAGDVARAHQALDRAGRTKLTTAQRLEVATLLAEAYQVAGKNRRAIAQYDRVRALDPASTAADNADFAAARLTLSSGDRVGAKERFERYLKTHPTGRFRPEVERVLATLRDPRQATTTSTP